MREYSAVVLNFPFWKPEEQELELVVVVVVVVVMMGEGRGARMCLTNSMSTDLAYILSKRIQCDDFYTINSNQYNFLSFFCAYLKISICIWHLGVTMICGVTDHYLKETRAFS